MLIKRAVAIAIDSFIVQFVPVIFYVFTGSEFLLAFLSITFGVWYQWYYLTRRDGQTPGKHFIGIRVVSTSGRPVNDTAAVVRYFGYLINHILMLGWIVAVLTGRGFHDRLADTKVVDA